MKPAPINPHVALLKVVLSGRNDVDAVIAGMVRRKQARRALDRQIEAWKAEMLREFHKRLLAKMGYSAAMIERMLA